MPDRLDLSEIEAILRAGRIGESEAFPDWLNRANQLPMDDIPGRLAEYFYKLGLKSLRWEQLGPWKRDHRVSITHLKAILADGHAPAGRELGPLSHCYDWTPKHQSSHVTGKWFTEVLIEYHSAPGEYRPVALEILENARVGDITYPIWLNTMAASTDVGVLSTVLTAIGIFDIRSEPDPIPRPDSWSSYLVANLPPSDLATNHNMPPLHLAHFVAMILRNPHSYFLMRTEVWVPLQVKLSLLATAESRIQELKMGKKWWR